MVNGAVIQDEKSWPPKSPFEALLSSPSGRKKLEQRRTRSSVSPSPLKSSRGTLNCAARDHSPSLEIGSEDEEDEETIALQLAAIEARLKLKRLQAKKAQGDRLDSENAHGYSKVVGLGHEKGLASLSGPLPTTAIEVPVSPHRRRIEPKDPISPSRVLLGIDKGLTGKHVSLRKAPKSSERLHSLSSREPQVAKPKTFSERITEARGNDIAEAARREKVAQVRAERSKGFAVAKEELERYREESSKESESRPAYRNVPTVPVEQSFSRADVLKAMSTSSGLVQRNHSTFRNSSSQHRSDASTRSEIRPHSSMSSRSSDFKAPSRASNPPEQVRLARETSSRDSPPSLKPSYLRGPDLFEPYSTLHLSRRSLPQTFVDRMLDGKNAVVIPQLLKDIKSPDYEIPDALCESDFVVFGIVASKSAPFTHNSAAQNGRRTTSSTNPNATSFEQADELARNEGPGAKYMVFTLTNLKWTLELYLFGSAYSRYWKLNPGTVIAILNPNIMPPKKGREDTGRFSLVLNNSDDTVLEIGSARDMGFCKAQRKDGKECKDWIDARKTEFCEFHVSVAIERSQRGRMELNGGGGGGTRIKNHRVRGRGGKWHGKERWEPGGSGNGLLKEGKQWDRSTQSAYFVAPGPSQAGGASYHGRGDVRYLDRETTDLSERGQSKEERTRRRLADEERERLLTKQLSEIGQGTGADYMRSIREKRAATKSGTDKGEHGSAAGIDSSSMGDSSWDAGRLGLLGNHAREVKLSPIKRKHSDSVVDGERVRRKTRFVTESGIEEAGTESLGVADARLSGGDEELEFV
ncbi:hypothetical protein MMC25_001149 [Agyrium rufum]|nr:hypothetical protein [Agyrium rufum]